ncbi:MAG: fibronectin type III-like domain-contianing protein, partial [Propionibacteriaceae bacterium]
EASVARPVRELKAFTKVTLEPGEAQQVTLQLDVRSFSFWSSKLGRWAVEAGDFAIEVGSSSRDLAVTEIVSLDAPSVASPLGPDSTLHEWLADDRGRELLTANGAPPILADPELVKVIGTMPMSTLAAFNGMAFDTPELEKLVAQL